MAARNEKLIAFFSACRGGQAGGASAGPKPRPVVRPVGAPSCAPSCAPSWAPSSGPGYKTKLNGPPEGGQGGSKTEPKSDAQLPFGTTSWTPTLSHRSASLGGALEGPGGCFRSGLCREMLKARCICKPVFKSRKRCSPSSI